tara:strand:+ start:1051 stop:1239 length:189 start_codon:yes stop_codon:yes gene_type:complete
MSKIKKRKLKPRVVVSDPITMKKVIRKHIQETTIPKTKVTFFMSIKKIINKVINLVEKIWQK